MLCLFPLVLHDRTIQCGQCVSCRVKRQNEKAAQQLLEYATTGIAASVTLTYSDEHLPVVEQPSVVALFTPKFRASDAVRKAAAPSIKPLTPSQWDRYHRGTITVEEMAAAFPEYYKDVRATEQAEGKISSKLDPLGVYLVQKTERYYGPDSGHAGRARKGKGKGKSKTYDFYSGYIVNEGDPKFADYVLTWEENRRKAEAEKIAKSKDKRRKAQSLDEDIEDISFIPLGVDMSSTELLANKMDLIGKPEAFAVNKAGAPTVDFTELQRFFKRLRYHVGMQPEMQPKTITRMKRGNPIEVQVPDSEKFELVFAYGLEYGDEKGRPHYHVSVFLRSAPPEVLSKFQEAERQYALYQKAVADAKGHDTPEKKRLENRPQTFAEWMLGSHPEEDPEGIGPLQKAWDRAAWNRFRQGPDFTRKCEPFRSENAVYISKYIVKAQIGLRRSEHIETLIHCRADGSAPEKTGSSRGKSVAGEVGRDALGYVQIKRIAEKFGPYYERYKTLALSEPRKVEKILQVIEQIAADKDGRLPHGELDDQLQERAVTAQQFADVVMVYRCKSGWFPFEENGKITFIRPGRFWQQRFYEFCGISAESITQARWRMARIREANDKALTVVDPGRELKRLERVRRKSRRWRNKAYSYGKN